MIKCGVDTSVYCPHRRGPKNHCEAAQDPCPVDVARDEFEELREDDKDFAKQWDPTEEDFLEWYEDVWLPSQEH